MKLHSKTKGTIGHLAIAQALATQNYAVFTELGDLSRIDLLAIKDNKITRIQVKACTVRSVGNIEIRAIKSGPNYKFRYTEKDVDVFAVYVLERNLVLFINAKWFLETHTTLMIRIDPAKNNQLQKIQNYEKFLNLDNALDYSYWVEQDKIKPKPVLHHGTENCYLVHKCRCALCKKVNTEKTAKRRQKERTN
jgi:hypothetical protein